MNLYRITGPAQIGLSGGRTECLQTLLINVHALGRDQAAALLQPPRHEIQL